MWDDDSLQNIEDLAMQISDILCGEFANGDIADEEDFTSALMREMRNSFNSLRLSPTYSHGFSPFRTGPPQYIVHARVATHGFKQSEENLSGADILLGYAGQIEGRTISKSVLVQAKLFRGDGEFLGHPRTTAEKLRLRQQCTRMQQISPDDAYVFIYSKLGIRFYSASDVLLAGGSGVNFGDGIPFKEFVTGLFACSIGDHSLDLADRKSLRRELRRLEIKHGFNISVEAA